MKYGNFKLSIFHIDHSSSQPFNCTWVHLLLFALDGRRFLDMQGLIQDLLLGREKNWSCEAHCSWEGSGGCSPRKCYTFRLSEVASGGFWGPRRFVAEMLLHVKINLAWNLEGRTQVRGRGYPTLPPLLYETLTCNI